MGETIPLKKVLTFEKGKNPAQLVRTKTTDDHLPYLEADYFRRGIANQFALPAHYKVADVGDLVMIFDGSKSGEIFRSEEKGILASTMARLVFDKKKYSTDFVQYFIQSNFRELNEDTTGSGIPHINQEVFFQLRFPEVHIDVQKEISQALSEKLNSANLLKGVALRQFQAVLRLQQKQLDEIFSLANFASFKMKKLKQLDTLIHSGKAVSSVGGHYVADGVPYIQVNNIDNEGGFVTKKLIRINSEAHEALKTSEVLKNDVLINIVGPPIGKICWYDRDEPANINQAIVRVRCPESLDYRFLTYLLRTSHFYAYFDLVKVGARQWNVSKTNCEELEIPEVPKDVQLELVAEWESKDITGLKRKIKTQLDAVKALPAAILREAFHPKE